MNLKNNSSKLEKLLNITKSIAIGIVVTAGTSFCLYKAYEAHLESLKERAEGYIQKSQEVRQPIYRTDADENGELK